MHTSTAATGPPALPAFLAQHPYYGSAVARLETDPPTRPSAGEGGRLSLLSTLRDPAALRALLLVPPSALATDHNLSAAEAGQLLAWVADRSSPLVAGGGGGGAVPCSLAASLAGQAMGAAPLPTGLPELDRRLLGGLRAPFVFELTGAAGCGKTRLAMQWAAAAVLGSTAVGAEAVAVLWLHTGPAPSVEAQLLALLRRTRHNSNSNKINDDRSEALRCRFHAMAVTANLEEFRTLQLRHIAHLLSTRRDTKDRNGSSGSGVIRLLVIDSLAQLVHRSHSGALEADGVHRQNSLVALVQDLKRLADSHGLCVLLLTHAARSNANSSSSGSGSHYTAAAAAAAGWEASPGEFGRMLYHSVNVRLQLAEGLRAARRHRHRGNDHKRTKGASCLVRVLRIVKSPLCGHLALSLVESAATGELVEVAAAAEDDNENDDGGGAYVGLDEDVVSGIDPLDYQTIPHFVYT